jgi:hypothetical protein
VDTLSPAERPGKGEKSNVFEKDLDGLAKTKKMSLISTYFNPFRDIGVLNTKSKNPEKYDRKCDFQTPTRHPL